MKRLSVFTPCRVSVRQSEGDGEKGESRLIEGYAIVFGKESVPLSQSRTEVSTEVIAPEAVTRELLDRQNISMTMFHNMELLLARADHGQGTLAYEVNGRGVRFQFEAPRTADGDKALELVRRGDIAGCSFMFSLDPHDKEAVTSEDGGLDPDGRKKTVYTVRRMTGIYDFTLTQYPAYPDTECALRSIVEARAIEENAASAQPSAGPTAGKAREQVTEMRRQAALPIMA